MATILIIDDDTQVCETMESLLMRQGHACHSAYTLRDGLDILEENEIDLVFLDISLPDGDGLNVLPDIRQSPSRPEVIILTGKGDAEGAELAIRGGVWDYLVKPSPIKQTTLTLNRALKYRDEKRSHQETRALDLDNMIGRSPVMKASFDIMAQAAQSDANVLIYGETGTGKELCARTVHDNSNRRSGQFVVVDCASLTESLVESTLFGHRKGAFTGANSDRVGLVKLADGGTLFLDEVGEMPLTIQKSFLRILQERRFRPVGDTREVTSDFRLVSATNRNLEEMAEKGEFRSDLLFRLKTISIHLPSLRERRDDIRPLAIYHITRLCERYDEPVKGFAPDFFTMLEAYEWPGNVRELFNVLERAFVAAHGEQTLYALHLPQDVRIKVTRAQLGVTRRQNGDSGIGDSAAIEDGAQQDQAAGGRTSAADCGRGKGLLMDPVPPLKEFKSLMEKRYLEELIEITGGDVQKLVRISGLSRSHVYALMKKHDVTL